MIPEAMLKHFCGHVILGLPKSPFALVRRLNRIGDRPHLFLRRCPLWLRLIPLATVHISAACAHPEILLLELSDLAERNCEKNMTLIPCSIGACRFVETYREALEPSYIIQNDPTLYGGTQ